MKFILSAIAVLLFASSAEAGRAHTDRVYVIRVQCTILESFPLQYAGTANFYSRTTGRTVRMRFLATTNTDGRNVCLRLRAATGRDVTAYFNIRQTIPVNPISRVIHGFTRAGQTYLIDGSIFQDISE